MKKIFLLTLLPFYFHSQTKKDTAFSGFKCDYYKNGNPKSKIEYIKGKPNGLAITYYENNIISEIGTYSNNRWIGNYRQYYDNGNLQHNFSFDKNGKRVGLQRYYYKNGVISIITNFFDGKEIYGIEFNEKGEVTSKIIMDPLGKKFPPEHKIYESKKVLLDAIIELAKKENTGDK